MTVKFLGSVLFATLQNVHGLFTFVTWMILTFYNLVNCWHAARRASAFIGLSQFRRICSNAGLACGFDGFGSKEELWIVECKSSKADFMSDNKWHNYLEWCDRFYWAVDRGFPLDLLPEGHGLIIADAYDAAIVKEAPLDKLAPARRKKMVRKFAENAALRLQRFRDPDARL